MSCKKCLADFVKNTLLQQASFDLHHLFAIYLKKNKIIYILFFLRFFIYILYLFIAWNGGVLPAFPVGRFAQGFEETVHFLEISFVGNWVKFLYFLQWLSLSFVFVGMFVICLFNCYCHYYYYYYYYYYDYYYYCYYYYYYYYYYYWLALIRHIRFC